MEQIEVCLSTPSLELVHQGFSSQFRAIANNVAIRKDSYDLIGPLGVTVPISHQEVLDWPTNILPKLCDVLKGKAGLAVQATWDGKDAFWSSSRLTPSCPKQRAYMARGFVLFSDSWEFRCHLRGRSTQYCSLCDNGRQSVRDGNWFCDRCYQAAGAKLALEALLHCDKLVARHKLDPSFHKYLMCISSERDRERHAASYSNLPQPTYQWVPIPDDRVRYATAESLAGEAYRQQIEAADRAIRATLITPRLMAPIVPTCAACKNASAVETFALASMGQFPLCLGCSKRDLLMVCADVKANQESDQEFRERAAARVTRQPYKINITKAGIPDSVFEKITIAPKNRDPSLQIYPGYDAPRGISCCKTHEKGFLCGCANPARLDKPKHDPYAAHRLLEPSKASGAGLSTLEQKQPPPKRNPRFDPRPGIDDTGGFSGASWEE